MAKELFIIPNHVQRAISLLVTQFQDSPRIKALLTAYCLQVQDLQNAAEQLYYQRALYNEDPTKQAYGVQLDGIGQILNLPRLQGESDEQYRLRLRTRSLVLFSSGTPEQMIAILKEQSEATFVKYYDMFPAGYEMFTNGGQNLPDNTDLPEEEQVNHNILSQMLHESSPAAVQFVPVTCSYGVEPVFTFGPDAVDQPLVVNTETDINVPLYAEPDPPEQQYYVNTGYAEEVYDTGGFSDITNYFILGLDGDSVLELDDGGNLLLFSEDAQEYTPGAGYFAEMLYYNEEN